MGYDDWKAREPDLELDDLEPQPAARPACTKCGDEAKVSSFGATPRVTLLCAACYRAKQTRLLVEAGRQEDVA